MTQPRICFQTQTPLIRPLRELPPGTRVEDLREGHDHLVSPGGVTRMLRGLSAHLEERGRTAPTTWVSLARSPARLRIGHGRLELVALPPDEREQYGAAKSAFWDELHGIAPPSDPAAVAAGLRLLGNAIGERSRALHEEEPFDLFYTHDFQLLTVGEGLPAGTPRIFRWHGPMRRMSDGIRPFIARALDHYDAVIVSTQAYARELRSWGVRVPIHASYPYLDESRRRVVTQADIDAFDAKHDLAADDITFALVARLDAIKSQDLAIRALARIAQSAPRARLLLIGGGGFSGGRQGLGLSKASDWLASLQTLARELGVDDRVIFTGEISDVELDVAFTRARAILLPSVMEGFGLAAVEGWLYGKPALVSRGAGVAELVVDGENGFTFAPGHDADLADSMFALADDEEMAQRMGDEGRRSAKTCYLDRGADDVWEILRAQLPREQDWQLPGRRRW